MSSSSSPWKNNGQRSKTKRLSACVETPPFSLGKFDPQNCSSIFLSQVQCENISCSSYIGGGHSMHGDAVPVQSFNIENSIHFAYVLRSFYIHYSNGKWKGLHGKILTCSNANIAELPYQYISYYHPYLGRYPLGWAYPSCHQYHHDMLVKAVAPSSFKILLASYSWLHHFFLLYCY